jgi:hypothetical protein
MEDSGSRIPAFGEKNNRGGGRVSVPFIRHEKCTRGNAGRKGFNDKGDFTVLSLAELTIA